MLGRLTFGPQAEKSLSSGLCGTMIRVARQHSRYLRASPVSSVLAPPSCSFHSHTILKSALDRSSPKMAVSVRSFSTSGGAPDKALHHACFLGDAAGVQQLIAAGSDLEGRDGQGGTALVTAVVSQNEECVKVLLDNGANPSVQVHLSP